jgi:hypothetical protein
MKHDTICQDGLGTSAKETLLLLFNLNDHGWTDAFLRLQAQGAD